MARVARRGVLNPTTESANTPCRQSGTGPEATNRARKRFLTWASHELRTPLNAVLCYNDLLEMGVLGALNERQSAAVERMGVAIRRLCRLVDDLLELCELESDEPVVSEGTADLRCIVDDVVAQLRPRAAERGLDLAVEGGDGAGPRVDTDGGKVRRVLLLLCGHALTLADRGDVTVRLRERRNGVRIDVTAPGRVGAIGAGDGGPAAADDTGLGVVLADRIAAAVGGRVAVYRRPGGETTASLRLPVKVPAS
ncbi:MAG TPA: HAMP domain-containing sensor histidine kinase [Longimicrobiales bacterium]